MHALTDSRDTLARPSVHLVSGDLFGGIDFEKMERRDLAENPYEVWHDEGEGRPPTFKTWPEARSAAANWNRDCPGHVARKRQLISSPNVKDEGRDER